MLKERSPSNLAWTQENLLNGEAMYQRLVRSWNSGWIASRDTVRQPWRGLPGGARGYWTVHPRVGVVSPPTQNLR